MKFAGVSRNWFLCVGFTSCFFAEITRSKKLLGLLDVLHILSINQLISFCHILVISLAVVARISKVIWSRVVRVGMWLLPDCKGGAFSFPIQCSVGNTVVLCWNKSRLLLVSQDFYHSGVLSCVIFNIYWNVMGALSTFLCAIRVYWFVYTEPCFIPTGKPSWWHMIFLLCSCIEFASILLGIFASRVVMKEIGL